VNRKVPVILAALALAAVACSGGGSTGRKPQAGGSVVIDPSASPTTPGALASPSLAPSAAATAGGGKVPSKLDPTLPPNYRPPTGFPIPKLFSAAENTIGITSDKIVLCTHAALNLAAVFRVNAADLNVYWEYVNRELGGIYGRKVVMSYADDKYGNQPSDVQAAYQTCHDRKPFMLLGGIGFDQIPLVRSYAEQDHQLYIHHIAREDFSKRYSFSFLPSVETAGRRAAQWVLSKHRNESIGVVYRNSENWEPGHRTFKSELAAHGVKPVRDLPVDKNATVYSTQIQALSSEDVKVVFLWENAVADLEFIKQADAQGYHPTWLVFPFNIVTSTLDDAMVSPRPAEGIAMWPAYRPGDASGTYAPYANEIRLFEAKHRQYSDGPTDDITWMTWLGWHQLHRVLLDCGKDCTRNRLVGLLQANLVKPVLGDCGFDFKSNGHVGGFDVNVFQAYMSGGNAWWKNVASCKRSF
jgi:ABC-type branched-subunit amino acid transport system substrate-binding protein